MSGQLIVDEARTWIGTPFEHQKSVKLVASDCAGLVKGVLNNLNYNIEYESNYAINPSADLFRKTVEKYCFSIELNDIQKGDFLIFSFLSEPQHIAIVTEINPIYIIHSFSRVGKVTEHILDKVWQSRLRGAYRLKEIKE